MLKWRFLDIQIEMEPLIIDWAKEELIILNLTFSESCTTKRKCLISVQ